MDISNIVALVLGGIGFIISIVSFVLTPTITLKSKRLEKRLDYRFQLFEKIIELWELFDNQSTRGGNFAPLMADINKLIQLYGYKSEIKLFKEVVDFYNSYNQNKNDENSERLKAKFSNFFLTSFNKYRKEIALDKLPKN